MGFVKIYSSEHLDDVGMNRCWSLSYRYKFNQAQKSELEKAVKKLAHENFAKLGDGSLGYQVNDKTIKVWFADGDSDGEYLARNIADDLFKLVNRKWCFNNGNGGYTIDENRVGTSLIS
jgi:hypothetical protein